jgi:hypothetical protein
MIIAQSLAALNNRLTTLKYQHTAITIEQKFVDEEFDINTQNKISEVEKAK